MEQQEKKQEKRAKIIVDSRELNGGVPKALDLFCQDTVEFEVQTLAVGDYILSDRVAAERKETDDFWKTAFERRELFSQLGDLKKAYDRAILIIEGDGLYSRNVNPNVVRGIISAIEVDMYIPIIYTKDQHDTAMYLSRIAQREQIEERKPLSVHGKRSHMDIDQQREYIVSAICDIGPLTAKRLLEHFETVENVMTARDCDLMNINKIGPETARKIRNIVGGKYAKRK